MQELVDLVKEFRDCFAWEYYEMPGLDRSIVEHRLPIKPEYRPFKQAPRRFNPNVLDDIKKETERDLNKTTPMDSYPMPIADMLVDAAAGPRLLASLMVMQDTTKFSWLRKT